jgi:hypothetical protein
VGRERIDEEPALFAMDEVEAGKWKRLSGGGRGVGVGVIGVIGGQRSGGSSSSAGGPAANGAA